ncbi:hypothetical protein E1B28_009178 [Marasmius oreades]|uniref:TRIP4/RQT4 C2HC5-type zinc finger domain-containing protein n=1 Tax=Marasmius oreades TaxID=181124 RepID=A0A9P7S042_9AGAR|nr:uncharacterized protein E1B28_009178 [Marasmius oreades]KAG7092865.1 hypothetical protein E1B28_009178 [Marasmius oreades]
MYKTAWTGSASSLPSDRIKPSYSNTSTPRNQGKGKGKGRETPPPKSKQVREIESLLNALRASNAPIRDPKGGCFCQAREHALSPYTPICRSCGLILCILNSPQYCCPSRTCLSSLLSYSPHAKESLLHQLESRLSETLAKEAAERERVIEEAKRETGAFPSLPGSSLSSASGSPASTRPSTPQQHKVLSLNSKTKRVIVTTTTTTMKPSRPNNEKENEGDLEEEVLRVPPPPSQVTFAKGKPDPSRPWKNYRDGSVKYVSAAKEKAKKKEERKQNKKAKGKERADGGNEVQGS